MVFQNFIEKVLVVVIKKYNKNIKKILKNINKNINIYNYINIFKNVYNK